LETNKNRNLYNVLSLCDGISCGYLAFKNSNINIGKYYASEIKDIAIKCSKYNHKDIIHIGDVNKVSYKDGILHTENGDYKTDIDIVILGSPCQTFSVAMRKDLRIGLEDKEKSGLFLECYRIIKEINPKYFFMENVASMKNEDRDTISRMLGVEPIRINSEIVAPCLRDRYYWTNIKVEENIARKNINLQSILTSGYTNRQKGRCLITSDCRPVTTPVKMFHRYYSTGFGNLIFKDKEHYEKCVEHYNSHYRGMKAKDIPVGETNVYDGVRYLNQEELEKCQTFPKGYTKCLTRNEAANVIGDGWTVDVIAHIFSYIK